MAEKTAKKGDMVIVAYTGKLETGEIFDSSKAKAPLRFEVGAGRIIKGFDQAVMGMKVGEDKDIVVDVNEAYGPRSENYVKEVPKNTIPKDVEIKEGMMLIFKREDGLTMPSKLTKINKDTVTVDFNHPLAGKNLLFSIKLIAIE